MAELNRRRYVRAFAWLLFAFILAPLHAHATTRVVTLDRAEAAPADWNSTTPPATGWTQVKLMDNWSKRWPRHEGVVWYRLRWNQEDANTPIGLLLDYVCMADAVYVNGSLVHSDQHLTEPLSRSWIAPQYFVIDAPLLHTGKNTLLVRVSGLTAYQPGLGVVRIGDMSAVGAMYRSGRFWRYDIHLLNFALSAVLGLLFGMFWLLRRKDTMFAWYALTTLFGAGYAWNFVASGTWPFTSTDAWQAMIAVMFLASVACYDIFLLRFCERRWPRIEAALLLACGAAVIVSVLNPHRMGVWRNAWIIPAVIVSYGSTLLFLWHAARTPRADLRVMGLCLLLPVLASLRDLAVYLQWTSASNFDLGAMTAPLTMVGMGFAIAWRFSTAMRRVEGFNAELQQNVADATTRLSDTLSREHALALAHIRVGERLNLVRDLHDGFGGSLLGAIAALEQSAPSTATTRAVTTLKELREDLRLVIDTTTHERGTDLIGLLAPLRHRWSQRLEAADIDSRWRLDGLDDVRLGAARSLDLLRLLQEALTNVLKHSDARRVDILVACDPGRLQVRVCDDGRGFDPQIHGATGAGLSSLRARCNRLGGELLMTTSPGNGVALSLDTAL